MLACHSSPSSVIGGLSRCYPVMFSPVMLSPVMFSPVMLSPVMFSPFGFLVPKEFYLFGFQIF
jgi:hypothetical protein